MVLRCVRRRGLGDLVGVGADPWRGVERGEGLGYSCVADAALRMDWEAARLLAAWYQLRGAGAGYLGNRGTPR